MRAEIDGKSAPHTMHPNPLPPLTDNQHSTMARLAQAWVCLMAVAQVVGCVYDPNRRCDSDQRYNGFSCLCAANAILVNGGQCVACGANEVGGENGCVCAQGMARQSPDAGCEPLPADQGAACDTVTTPCSSDSTFSYCFAASGTSGYCTTSDCASDAGEACTGGYACEVSAAPSYCRRPPIGLGNSCTSAADCAGSEATLCDTMISNECQVQGCTLSPNNCFPGWDCCDLSSYGIGVSTVCVPAGKCPT